MKKYFSLVCTVLGLVAGASQLSGAIPDTSLNLCNNNDEKIFVAVAYQPSESTALMSRGWWGIDSKSCSKISFPVVGDKILVHAQSSSQIYHWLGNVELCINSVDAFDLKEAANITCNQPGEEKRAFKELSLTELRAGVTDGVAKIEFNPSEATRVGGGLKFCNDTSDPIYISFAQKKSTDAETTVNGWFLAKPGLCFEANRDKEMDEVLFFANTESRSMKWKGDIAMCTNDFDGYSHANAAKMDCSANNLLIQYFTKAKLPVEGEFVHRFKTEEADSARSVLQICNSQDQEISLAIAVKDSEVEKIITRGWFNLKKGECAKDQVVDAEEVLLHIENFDRKVLMEGELKACVNNEIGFQYSQADTMACNGANEEKVGFALQKIEAGKVRIDVP